MFRSPRDVGTFPAKKVVNKTWESYNNQLQERYGCDICSEGGWTSETEVEIHKTKVHYRRDFMRELRKRVDYCFICIKKCESKEAVIKHIKTEHLLSTETCMRVEREIFICNHCSAIFFNKENLALHLRSAHLNIRNKSIIKCLICLKNILASTIPAHFYMHNIQSVSTCRICLLKCDNTRELKEHIKQHPYYLKCDMCYYETGKIESFQNHVLLRHKKIENTIKEREEPDTNQTINSGDYVNSMTDNVSNVSSIEDHDDDLMTVIEVIDTDDVTNTDDVTDNVTKDVKGSTPMRKKLKGVKKKKTKNRKVASESALAVENLMRDAAMTVTDVTDSVSTDKDLSNEDAFSDNGIFAVNISKPDNDDREFLTDVIKGESIKDKDVTTYDSISENNLMTLDDISVRKTDEVSDTMTDEVSDTMTDEVSDTMTDEVSDRKTDEVSDMMTDEVIADQDSDDNVMTVIEISDNDLTAQGTNLTKNVKTGKEIAEDFKRFFIPESPAYLRLQRIAGLRGVRLSNDVHVCILCREVCVGLGEMRSHITEHIVKKEASNSYECSCGEQFTNKVLLKHHTFKSKHAIK